MRLRTTLLLASVLAAPCVASAQPFEGFYIGAGAGGNFAETKSSSFGGFKLDTDPGFVGLGSVGYGFGNGLRIEAEGNYRENNATRATLFGQKNITALGSVRSYGGMGNVLFDIDVGMPNIFPYVGAGLGYSRTEIDRKTLTSTGLTVSGSGNDGDGHLAYQAIAGASFPFASVPGLSLTAEYRFFGQDGGSSSSTNSVQSIGGVPTLVTSGRLRLREQFDHSVLIGLRYAFGQVAPSPDLPLVSHPVVSHQYLVFFDWDRADLTVRARQIIASAAHNATSVSYTRIEVNGYTDTSGTAAYNQRLSVRRAQSVAAELVRDGVPRQAIAIQGFGETHLLVPTAAGVREPQNRRVEIVIR